MRYRIVNRTRFITFVTVLILLFYVIVAGIFSKATALDNNRNSYVTIEVAEGDTLWDITRTYGNPKKDIGENIYDICKENGIKNSIIYPGEELLIKIK